MTMASIWQYMLVISAPFLLFILYNVMRFVVWFVQVKRIQSYIDVFAVMKPHWLWGHTDVITGANEQALNQYLKWTAETEKGAFSMSLGFASILILCHPSTAKKILATSEPKGCIPNTNSSYKLAVPFLGDGLGISSGAKWIRNRKLLTPGFHNDILKPYMKIFNNCTDKLIAVIQNATENGHSIEITNPISLCTLNIIRKCAFSIKEDIQETDKQFPYVNAVKEITKLTFERAFSLHLYIDSIYSLTEKGRKFFKLCSYSHGVAKEVIRKRKEELKTDNKAGRYVDFLDILLLAKDENGKGLTDQEILDEVETFMAAGHDTTASGISWILYNLARNPNIQTKVQYEIDAILQDKLQVEWNDLNKIPYTTRCIKESMRMHPPLPSYWRELSRPFEISGHKLLPGSIVQIDAYCIHHNPDVWGPNHMDFDPDRFLPDNLAKMDSHAFIPFSAGPRNCIGKKFAMNEMKTTIMKILYHFDVSLDEEHKVEMVPAFVLKTVHGIKLHFQTRNGVKI